MQPLKLGEQMTHNDTDSARVLISKEHLPGVSASEETVVPANVEARET